MISFAQYTRFLTVGGFVGLITVACRELIGYIFAADTAVHYSISVVVAYLVGTVLSFLLNHKFTFRSDAGAAGWSKFLSFTAIAIGGLVSTWLLSLAIRYGLGLQTTIGKSSASIAFVAAALLTSLLTYPLNALFVFRKK